jgi:aspartate kinase
MKVFKFGGASVKNAVAVKNVVEILKRYPNQQTMVVVSAMGKTTNALEELTRLYHEQNKGWKEVLENIRRFHFDIVAGLFQDTSLVNQELGAWFDALEKLLEKRPSKNYDYEYGRIVTFGELFSTCIVNCYLNENQVPSHWFDARKVIRTNASYRDGKVDWKLTESMIKEEVLPHFQDTANEKIGLTQGFISSTTKNRTTTLGREGSDYTAALFAYFLDAEEVIIWKDVPGLLNADPKFFPEARKLDSISYRDAIELAYYGASIIHPKTIKPLQNKEIPLRIKSFIAPGDEGSVICGNIQSETRIPCYLFKTNQLLISISPKDFSFIAEENLYAIFGIFARCRIKINLMQNSAISFSVCIDNDPKITQSAIKSLEHNFNVRYNQNLELITIRNYNQETIDKVVHGRKIMLEQKSRLTAQLIVSSE